MKKETTLRTALVVVLTMLSASMYAENEPVKYIDSDGQEKYVVDYTVLTGDEDTLTSGWYVVNQPALISLSGLMIKGDVRIILCDECVWSINEVVNGNPCPFGAYMGSCLRFYAQSTGEYAGKLHEDEKALHAYNCCPYFFNGDSLEINGGIIEFIGWDDNSPVIFAQNVTINGGRLNLSKIERGITCPSLHLNGGELNISASDMAVIVGQELSFGKSYCDFTCECSSFAYYGDDDIKLSDFMRVKFNDMEFIGSAPFDITDTETITKISSHYDEELATLAIVDVDNSVDVSDAWFTLTGVRLMAKPTDKGVYIHNGRKVQIK